MRVGFDHCGSRAETLRRVRVKLWVCVQHASSSSSAAVAVGSRSQHWVDGRLTQMLQHEQVHLLARGQFLGREQPAWAEKQVVLERLANMVLEP